MRKRADSYTIINTYNINKGLNKTPKQNDPDSRISGRPINLSSTVIFMNSHGLQKPAESAWLRYVLFAILLITFSIETATAQDKALAPDKASVNGYVRDAQNGETLISVNVVIDGTTIGTATNTLGYYTLTGLNPGTVTIRVTYLGFRTFRKEVTLEANQTLRLDIELEPDDLLLDEVVVIDEVYKEESRNVGVTQVQVKLIKELPAVFEADVFRSLQLMPGVKAASDFSSGLYIRGGGPDQTLILLDRTTVYNPSHFFGFFSTFNPDAIKDLRLYKGGYPATYGGRLGSVLDIYNKDGNRNEFAGTATLGLLASRVAIEGPYSKGSYMIAARRSTIEPLLAALRQNNDNIPSTFYFYDINGKINFDAGDNNKLSLAFYGGQDNVKFPFATDAQFDLLYGNRTASLNWTHIFSERLFSNFTFTGSRYFSEPFFTFGGTSFERQNDVYDASAKADFEFIASQKHTIQAGFWGGDLVLRLADSFDNTPTFRSRIKTSYLSTYLQDTWRPTPSWVVTGGVRSSWYSNGDFLRLEPRLSVEHKLANDTRLQLAYGRYTQNLSLITNEAFSGFDIWLTTGPGVAPAYGDQFVAGVKTQPIPGYNLDVEAYYRSMNDLFELDPFLPDVAGLDYSEVFRFGEGYAYGLEVFLNKGFGKLTGFVGYTWGITRRSFPGVNEEKFYPPKYDRTHDANLVMNYQLSRKWKATSVFSYATGQAYTLPSGRTEFDNPFGSTKDNVLVVGKLNASRLPAYHRLDVSFSRAGKFFDFGTSELQLQLINVYSRRNVWFYTYDFDANPVKVESVNLLPILPTVSYTVNF
jgi:hypothetical protein